MNGRKADAMRSKIPLILLPGLVCDAALWQAQLRDLAPLASMAVPDLSRFESIDDMASAVLATAPPRFALAGLSMGGYVAQAMVRLAPERIARLALLDTTAREDRPEQTQARRTLMAMTRNGDFEGALELLLDRMIDPVRRSDAVLCDAILTMERRVGAAAFLRQQTAIIARPNELATVAASRVPLLVLCGENDAITPLAVHREIVAVRPDATFVVIESCGHVSTLERPAEVTAALAAWLRAGDDPAIF